MFEEISATVESELEVIHTYIPQYDAFVAARRRALENTKIYLSICDDLDVYVATSMRTRKDFQYMTEACEKIFDESGPLGKYNVRYFDPTLSAAEHHEDKGIIECLMVKNAKVILYFAQNKESLGKVSEYAMGLSLGKPVIILCPDDSRGTGLYNFYRNSHPLTRLVEFETGIVHGAMITQSIDDVRSLLERIFTNKMQYDLEYKAGTDAYHLLKERITGTTVRVLTDNKLLAETFWNNWHEIHEGPS